MVQFNYLENQHLYASLNSISSLPLALGYLSLPTKFDKVNFVSKNSVML